MNKILVGAVILIISLSILSCGGSGKKAKSVKKIAEPVKKVEIPDFNADSAYQYIADQVAFGPRVPETKAHKQCAEYLFNKMKSFTPDVQKQPFKARLANGKIVNGVNIIASFNPENRRRVLLGAHWDSRGWADMEPDQSKHKLPIDGANDGASGVGVLIEIARQLHMKSCGVGVDIIFFDLEDSGDYGNNTSWALGSQYWSKNLHIPNYRAMYGILLDMVGASNPLFTQEEHSRLFAPDVLKKVWAKAAKIGYEKYFVNTPTGGILDDHVYVNQEANIPMINIIHFDENTETGFFPHWHKLTDNLDQIDKTTLKVVGQTVLTVLYEE